MPDGLARGLSRILHPTMHVGPQPPSSHSPPGTLWFDTSGDYGTLADTPGALCNLGTGHDVSHNTGVILNFHTKDRDTHGFWTAGRFTIPPGHAGWYRLRYTLSGEFVSGSGAAGWLWQTWFRKNGTTAISSGSHQSMPQGTYHGTSGHATLWLNAGEYVEVWANQHAGAGTALRHAGWFSIERMAGIPGPQGPMGAPSFGDWTPEYVGAVSGVGAMGAANRGRYAKIGKAVFIQGHAYGTKGSLSGAVSIRGLPFPIGNIGNIHAAFNIGWYSGIAGWVSGYVPLLFGGAGSSHIQLLFMSNAATTTVGAVSDGSFGAHVTDIVFSGHYETDA